MLFHSNRFDLAYRWWPKPIRLANGNAFKVGQTILQTCTALRTRPTFPNMRK
jgi:hypothetical protein